MNRLIIIHSGMSEPPLARFEGRTPLDVARHVAMDRIVSAGLGGMVHTIPDGHVACSETGTAVLLGVSGPPWPSRAPLEVLGRDLSFPTGALVFRANLVTVVDKQIRDHTAGRIGTREARLLIETLNQEFARDGLRFHSGGLHRLLVQATSSELAAALDPVHTSPPHDLIGLPMERHLPTGGDAGILRDAMARARRLLANHDVNRVRLDLGENPATDIWFWGGGRVPGQERTWPCAFPDGCLVSDSPVIRGLGKALGMSVSSLGRGDRRVTHDALRQEAAAALGHHGTVVVYCHGADEATHRGDSRGKVGEIEAFDRAVVSPLLEQVRGQPGWRVAVGSDHRSSCPDQRHLGGPTPLALAGEGIECDDADAYRERSLSSGALDGRPGEDLKTWFGADRREPSVS